MLYKKVDPKVKLDANFCEKMDQVSGCKLPYSLKDTILKLIDKHTFNSGLSVNMDLVSMANIPSEFKNLIGKLLNHVCDVDHRTRDLVIDLMKAISKADPSEAEEFSPVARNSQPNSISPADRKIESKSPSAAPKDAVHSIGTSGM